MFSDIRLRRVKSQAVKFCDCHRKVKYAVGVLRFVGFGERKRTSDARPFGGFNKKIGAFIRRYRLCFLRRRWTHKAFR